MLVNFYKQYDLNQNLNTADIREALENKCADTIRRLNNASGNADREYELRKSLERLEEALVIFINDESRQAYDKRLKQSTKEGMLTNENIKESEVEEDYNLDTMDQGRLETLLEKIVSRQAAKAQEEAQQEETNNKSVYKSSSNNKNLNKDKSDSIARLALMEIETEMDGYIWRKRNEKLADYIDNALQLDSSNYLAWHARFINLLSFQGDQFRMPWDFTTLGKKELAKLTQDEIKSIQSEIELADTGGLSTYDISNSILEWEKTSVLKSKAEKDKIKNKFGEQVINSREQNILYAINQIKKSKKNKTLANVFDKVYQGHKEQSFTLQEKIRRMLPSESRTKELEASYNRALELAPIEERKTLKENMEEATNSIYYNLLDDGYNMKKEVIDSYADKRYKAVDGLEDDVANIFKQVRKRAGSAINPARDQACYILMAVMLIFMLSWFLPMNIGMVPKYIIMLSAYLITSITIIKLRGPYRYRDIIFHITSIPIFLAIISMFFKNTHPIEISSEANILINIILVIVVGRTLIQAIKKKSIKFIVTDLMTNGINVVLKGMVVSFFLGLIISFFSDVWAGLFMVVCMAIPSYIHVRYMEDSKMYKMTNIPETSLKLGIYNYENLSESVKGVFPGGKLFKIQ